MKRKLSIIFILFLLLIAGYFYLQGQEKYDLEGAKQDMKSGQTSETVNAGDDYIQEVDEPLEEVSPILIEGKNYVVERITKNQSIEISADKLANSNYSGEDRIDITGTVADGVEKINVKFFNSDSSFPDDDYDLKTFKSGDTIFKYAASPEFKVLDHGENVYLFTATGREGESVTKLTIKTDENGQKQEKEETTQASGELGDISFPKGSFGEAIMPDGTTAYYSDLKGLEIKKKGGLSKVICEAPKVAVSNSGTGTTEENQAEPETHSITSFLLDTYSTWVYWNTCRPTTKDLGISFYVLRLTADEEFKYEKHYLDYNNELHGILELKSGTGVTKENIGEKNKEFKSEEFEITEISDLLFKEIIIENRS